MMIRRIVVTLDGREPSSRDGLESRLGVVVHPDRQSDDDDNESDRE